MDAISLKDLPLPIAVIVICFYFLNQNNTEFGKKLASLVEQFTKEYKDTLNTVLEERRQWVAFQTEQNRQLMTIAQAATEAQTKNANEIHTLRNFIQPYVLNTEKQRRRGQSLDDAGGGGGGD